MLREFLNWTVSYFYRRENMKNLLLLAALLLIICCSSYPPNQKEFIGGETILPDNDFFYYNGRFDQSVPGMVKFSWSSSKITFQFKGTGCDILLSSKYGSEIYYNVTLDNSETTVLQVNNIKNRYKLFRNLKPAVHTVSIERRNEYQAGLSIFQGVILDSDGEMLKVKAESGKVIEYIGDSNSTGFGIEADSHNDPFAFNTQDSSKCYAAVASRQLGAEYNIIAWSGKGVYWNYGQNKDKTLPELYDIVAHDAEYIWSYSDNKPDLIVINLGTNDFSHMPPPKESFITTYKEFIMEINNKCPDTPIMCIVGHSLSDFWPINSDTDQPYKSLTVMKDYMSTLKEELSRVGIEIGLIDNPPIDHSLPFGAEFHPGLKQSEEAGKFISEKIKEYMNW